MELVHGSVKHYEKFVVFQDGQYYDEYDKQLQAEYVITKYSYRIPNSKWTMKFRCYSDREVN